MIKFSSPPGSTPIDDLSGLKFSWVQTLHDLNRAEAENISRAQKKYLESSIDTPTKWFNPTFFRKVHQAMFGEVWTWAGSWRRSTTNIGIKPQLIPMHLSLFCAEVISWNQQTIPWNYVEQSARIHHKLVSIHPFENGNGRFSRLVADRYLLANQTAHPVWPSEIDKHSPMREGYIRSLQAADKGNYQPLIELIREFQQVR